MKRLGSVALVSLLGSLGLGGLGLGLLGCDNASRLDKTVREVPTAAQPSAATPSANADHTGTLEDRVARLENNFAKYGEALDFLQKVYAQQKAQQQQQEESEPAPDAVFAVDIAPNLRLGLIEGPVTAPVTIVEAWDFA